MTDGGLSALFVTKSLQRMILVQVVVGARMKFLKRLWCRTVHRYMPLMNNWRFGGQLTKHSESWYCTQCGEHFDVWVEDWYGNRKHGKTSQ